MLVLMTTISQATALTALPDIKAQLTKSLKYNKPFTETSEGLVQTLVESGAAAPSVSGDAAGWWAGGATGGAALWALLSAATPVLAWLLAEAGWAPTLTFSTSTGAAADGRAAPVATMATARF